jgi:hypothetical protein
LQPFEAAASEKVATIAEKIASLGIGAPAGG